MRRRTVCKAGMLALLPGSLNAQVKNQCFEAQVVIVGAGAAGLAAALSAAEHGASVIVLEKMPTIGGNTLLSSGFYNAPEPQLLEKEGITDSNELFFQQTLEAGRFKGDPDLIRVLVEGSRPTMKWLEKYGIRFKRDVFQIYGGSWPRGHYPQVSHGRGYITFLQKACSAKGVPIKTNMNVTGFLQETKEGKTRVAGVKALCHGVEYDVFATKGVILASGGFTANKELCAQLDPRLADMTSTGGASPTGEIIFMAKSLGAKIVGMEDIQCNLGPEKGFDARSGYHTDVKRHILININGERFINEDGLRDDLRDAVLRQPGRIVFSLVDSRGFQGLSSLFQQRGASGEKMGNAWHADTIEELAEKIGVPKENLKATVANYNQSVDTKKDALGRGSWMLKSKIEKPPFYASRVRMAIHYTMGGILINTNAQVIGEGNEPIPGLYAAGETTGGIHGANRVGGNGILDALVFGRIAGQMAAGAEKPEL